MSEQLGAAIQKGLPWRRGISWTFVMIEGLIILGIGLFLIFNSDAARSTIRGLIGAFLIFNSVLGILSGLREETRTAPMAPYRLIRGGIGLIVGIVVVLQPVFKYVDSDAARTILAIGLAVWGLIGLYAAFATHGQGGFRWSNVILSAVSIVFSVMLFATGSDDNGFIRPVGIVALIVGAILLGYSYLLYRNPQTDDEPV